ncbi:hypothetical protein Poli38472_000292 [Pythium oligandrum]|uniref:AAA+ ATPase domain-containing protein n=1 Tax=Pythium oligandrum TaxID=41045 RepID=A0A8K1CBU4_PYTOL|nr:hypothetical protein Poli38472_000292 [Pythium oligandrum]|eukprot:TMW60250.1 hypothetical protein Poli38472_000292 [Pythium oligandrum]
MLRRSVDLLAVLVVAVGAHRLSTHPVSKSLALCLGAMALSGLSNAIQRTGERETDHTKINPHDYYTVSRQGITHFANNSSEYSSLEQFERENYIYSLLIKLPFFRRYRKWKRFTLWKQTLNARKRQHARISLTQNLFALLPHLHEALLELRQKCLALHRVQLFDFDPSGCNSDISRATERRSSIGTRNDGTNTLKTYTLSEFSMRLKAQKMECERIIDRFIAEAEQVAKLACEQFLYGFLQDAGFNEPQGKHERATKVSKMTKTGFMKSMKSELAKRGSINVQDDRESGDHVMSYTERATMRTQCRRVIKFLRVVEFLVSDALLQVAILSTERLLDEMIKIKDEIAPGQGDADAMGRGSASQTAVQAAILARYKHAPLFRVEVMLPKMKSLLPSRDGGAPVSPRFLRRQSTSNAFKSTLVLGSSKRQGSIVNRGEIVDATSESSLIFNPHQEGMRSQLETLVFNGLKAVTNRPRLLSNPMFKAYVDMSRDEGVGGGDGDDDGNENNNSELSSEGMDLDILIMEDVMFVDALRGIHTIGIEAYNRATDASKSLSSFLEKYHANVVFCRDVIDPAVSYHTDVDDLQELLAKYTEEINQFEALPDTSPCGLLLLDKSKLNLVLKPSPRQCLAQLHRLIPMVLEYKQTTLMAELTTHNDKISAIPASVDEYAETLAYLHNLQELMDALDEQYAVYRSVFNLVEDYAIKISDLDHTNAFLLSQKRAQLNTSMDLFENSCEHYTEKFGAELARRVPMLASQLTQLETALTYPKLFEVDSSPLEMSDYLDGVAYQLADLEEAVQKHYFHEKTLVLPQTSAFEDLEGVKADLQLKTDLWRGMCTWNDLTKQWDPLDFPTEVDVGSISERINAFYDQVLLWESQLSAGTAPLCSSLKARVEAYRVAMPIMQDLCCPCFEDRHYFELQSVLGFSIRSELTTRRITLGVQATTVTAVGSSASHTVGQLVAMQLGPFANHVHRIATDATQERSLKEQLEKIIGVWEIMEFDVRPYKDYKDYSILVGVEIIFSHLEESLVSLTTLLSSKYLAPIKDLATMWQRRLALFQETTDSWIECQRKWMHLESIFLAPDIQKQLPHETMVFTTVNQYWKDLMRKTRDIRNCMKVCGAVPQNTLGTLGGLLGTVQMGPANPSLTAGGGSSTTSNAHSGQLSLLETLNRHNASLEKIEKSLEDYLETKRGFFPRFYFISNDELLEMLAHAKEPQSVQRHLCKCFDALIKLDISDEGPPATQPSVPGMAVATSGTSSTHDILAMISPEGERVAFSRNLKARGNVEDWLNAVLSNMRVTLQRHMKTCLLDYQHSARETWLFRHPAQCVAVVSYIIWARECEVCFRSASKDPLKELGLWYQTICTQLSNLTRLVRTTLTRVQRALVVSLVTTDVHFRDVVDELVTKKVTSAGDFNWMRQLRYYWHSEQDECTAQQANCRIKYGYEYMGACSRLVITPLTDRCWMTITGALALSFGAAPSGPAGTGKTETSKDLAKALGTLCIVFNCSDQIDYKMMAKIFNGAVQSGSWACLDEFNRIDIEVLSVVAQQMTTLRHARLRQANEVLFEGKNVPMRDHHIIITMNPGYVGRTELPDNLKVCFRPVAMMVPDYALIAEILLFGEGFQMAKVLSKKTTKLYKLCSEQLSQQPHYDFGMRAVKSVLLMAGTLKRAQVANHHDESIILIKAMLDANLPKLTDDDIRLFNGIVRDLFPDELATTKFNGDTATLSQKGASTISYIASLEEEIDRQLQAQGFSNSPSTAKWKEKLLQLFETLEVRVGIVQTGASGSGKSTAYRILKDAVTALHDVRNHSDQLRFQKVVSFVLNPKSIAMNELYGFFHPMTREWTDGLASRILRQCITEKSEHITAQAIKNRSGSVTDQDAAAVSNSTGEGGPFYWITFDGPIDVLWIESMNTVLDDNTTLCLANGERIKLLRRIQLLFEVCDTSSASPATISRLGVVYYHPKKLGWKPVVEAWVQALLLPSPLTPTVLSSSTRLSARLQARVLRYFDLFIEPGFTFLRASVDRVVISTSDLSFVASVCAIFEALLTQRAPSEVLTALSAYVPPPSATTTASAAAAALAIELQQHRCLDLVFLFSFLWAFGGNLRVDAWKGAFQEFVYGVVKANESFFCHDLLVVNSSVATKISQVNDDFFNFYVDLQHVSFVPWEDHKSGRRNSVSTTTMRTPAFDYHIEMPLFQVLVPTTDMIKYSYLIQLLALDAMRPVLLTGATGVGKSVLVQQLLRQRKSESSLIEAKRKELLPIAMTFSARTSSLMTQITIESKLVKKRKTLLGAPPETTVVIFIDDVNLPQVESHGAQPPIELLRQYLEYHGVYDREKFFWKEICDTVLVAVGGLPGGGRHTLCPRFVRQFQGVFCMPSSDDDAMKAICSAIMTAHITAMTESSAVQMAKPVKDSLSQMVEAMVQLYRTVSQALLPTPTKCYYLFNLRDLTKLLQGMVLGMNWYGIEGLTVDMAIKLYANECLRVFRDRLMEESDKKWLSEQLVAVSNRLLGLSWTLEHVYDDPSGYGTARNVQRRTSASVNLAATAKHVPILFCPRPHEKPKDEVDGDPKCPKYEQVLDLDAFEEELEGVMKRHNIAHTTSPLSLVFFKEAMFHIAAIARILIQPRGHALLLGLAGSGKRSLARLAVFMMGYRCYEVELTKNFGLNEFRDVIKTMMIDLVDSQPGLKGNSSYSFRPTVLLLNEAQLISDLFLEDVNTLLNGGEIPKLFTLEEHEKALSNVRSLLSTQAAAAASKQRSGAMAATSFSSSSTSLIAGSKKPLVKQPSDVSRQDCEVYFHDQIQRAMHIIICHSPASLVFRARIRQFPSLVSCTTINHFDVWPSQALQYVANRFLMGAIAKDEHGDTNSSPVPSAARPAIGQVCMEVHLSVIARASEFLSQFSRHVYVTPKHYVDLIQLFLRIYHEQSAAMNMKLTRLSVGVIKLEETNALVTTLQQELVALQPILQNKTREAEQLLQQVGIDQAAASRVADRVAKDEAVVKRQQREVAACQADAQKDLDQALPALNAAVTALDSLDKKDITEVKAFIKPPQAVQVVMEAVCIMLSEKPDWDTSKRVLSRSTFMNDLKEYDKDNISAAILKRIRKYIENPEFAVEEVRKVSRAAMSLCMWVHAVDTYARIYKEVAPKRQRLAEMNLVLADANAKLAAKQHELALVMGNVQALKEQCDLTLAEKQRLVRESELTQARLQRAERLTVGLKDERVRWKQGIEQLRIDSRAILGDAFLAAAATTYLGPFTSAFRRSLMRHWMRFAGNLIEISPSFTLVDSYGDPMEMREWELLGLPSDNVSMENAVFVMKGNQQRWPLLIDPQQQATQWIKRLEAPQNLESSKAQDRELLVTVERCLVNGTPLLVEDLSEQQSLEPALESLLQKAFLRGGGNEKLVRLGDRLVPADTTRFRLYFTTPLANPHFAPDVFIRMNVINFTVTQDGLASQLLSDVVRRERVEVEERKHNLLYSITQDQKMLQQLESKILGLLSESKGNILDDVELIQALESAKHTSRIVTQRLEESELTKLQLLEIRDQYRRVAVLGALLFFVIAELTTLDVMYQYSLKNFRRLFIQSLEDAPGKRTASLDERLENLTSHLTIVVYRNIARGLFEAHKLLVAVLIAVRVLILRGTIHQSDLKMLDRSVVAAAGLAGTLEAADPHSSTSAPSVAKGSELDAVDMLVSLAMRWDAFTIVLESYRLEPSSWIDWMTSRDPFITLMPFESAGTSPLTHFERLVLVRWLREDASPLALRHFVDATLGERFLDRAHPKDAGAQIMAIYTDMDKHTPCLFLLSSGADPTGLLLHLAQECRDVYPERYHLISLGQGQGPIAESMLEECMAAGHWLVLQNVHLAKSWMPRLEEILRGFHSRSDIHEDFRLFLTAFPVAYFPIALLQMCVKVTNEPPKGVRANLQRSMALLQQTEVMESVADETEDPAASHLKQMELQLVFGLSFFHAIVKERAKFGSLGWNLTYDFSDADFLSVVALQHRLLDGILSERRAKQERTRKLILQKKGLVRRASLERVGEDDGDVFEDEDACNELIIIEELPWDALHFLTGEIYYGGRVTDEFDRRCLMTNLQRFCSGAALTSGAAETLTSEECTPSASNFALFAASDGSFASPAFKSADSMQEFVEVLSPALMDAPYVFGMHPNANVFYLKQETQRVLSLVLQLQTTHQATEGEEEDNDPEEEELDDEGDDDDDVFSRQLSSRSSKRFSSQSRYSIGSKQSRRRLSSSAASLLSPFESAEMTALQVASDIHERLPMARSVTELQILMSSSITEDESLVDPFRVVLQQELTKCNNLLATVHNGLEDLQRAIQGLVAMSAPLEQILQSLYQHQVPLEWRKQDGASVVTPTSSQSLALWVQHIQFRIEFLEYWAIHGQAMNGVYPLSVFCFPQGFFTAILQRHARKYVVPIHHLEFQFQVLRESFMSARRVVRRAGSMRMGGLIGEGDGEVNTSNTSQRGMQVRNSMASGLEVVDGAFISGLFLEGAQWSDERHCLCEPQPGVMHHPMPVIHVVPQVIATAAVASTIQNSKDHSSSSPSRTKGLTPSYVTLRTASGGFETSSARSSVSSNSSSPPKVSRMSTRGSKRGDFIVGKYVCPVYKSRARKGTLSTTGISNNFVLAIELPTEKPPEYYALNGTALICNLVV